MPEKKDATRTAPKNVIDMGLKKIPNPDYRNHPAYGQTFGKPRLMNRLRALRRMWPHFRRQAMIRLRARPTLGQPGKMNDNQEASHLLQQVVRDGVAGLRLSDDEMTKVAELVGEYVEDLSAKKANIPDGQEQKFLDNVLTLRKEDVPEVYAYIGKALDNHGVMAAASQYLGAPVQLEFISVMSYDVTTTHWRDNFPDVEHDDPQTSYFHIDSATGRMKCLLYLSEVTESNGPFSFVLGSNRLKVGFLEHVIRVSNDNSRLDKSDSDTREIFLALPKVLQKKSEFGNDLIDDSAGSKTLLACEARFTSEDGNLIFFDNRGVHRGGMLREGERHILQIGIMPMSER